MLFGRNAEHGRIAALLDAARNGRSGVLVLRGDAGVGKSALLAQARGQADGLTVLYACGIESEARLPYAGLHQLLRPILPRIDRLAAPQARALRGALGLDRGAGDEWFLVSLAVLNLLADAAEEQPLLCVVDDAHWLDEASAESLVFAARRLEAEGIVMLFAARDPEARAFGAPGLPELRLAGLDRAAAHALLDQHAGASLSTEARNRLIDGTDGNPLALLELSSSLNESQLAGLEPLPVGARVEQAFRSQMERLPEATRTVLLVAAADDTRSAGTVLRAAARLGADPQALDAAEAAGLVRVRDGQLEFRHPLIRSAVYQAAPFSRRCAAHEALAAVLDPITDADRRAWHRAAASVDLDASVAEELEQAAERAYRRSGFVAASLAFERAADLVPDTRHRARLLTASAEAAWFAGRLERAAELLQRARPLAAGPREQAEIDRWRGLLEMNVGVPTEARDLLVRAARELAPTDAERALHLLGLAGVASAYGGEGEQVPAIAAEADDWAADESTLTRFLACFVSGTGAYFAGAYGVAAQRFRSVLAQADEADAAGSAQLPGLLLLAGAAALFLGDDPAAERMNRRMAGRGREMGALPLVNEVLPRLALSQIAMGRWASAAADLAEGQQLATQIGQHQVLAHMLSVSALIAALRGADEECRSLAEQTQQLAVDRRLVHVANTARWALLELELGLGRPAEALVHAREIVQYPIVLWCGPGRIEAAARAGDGSTARTWLETFEAWAEQSGTQWAIAAAQRCRALLDDEPSDRAALLARARATAAGGSRPMEQARCELALGEFLRRTGQRVEARSHLRSALERFESLGARLWAERAREELRASGQTARRGQPAARNALTEQELQVARFVARGLSNREVAAQLFLSPRTIDFHLRKVFTKLGISSRTQLMQVEFDPGGRRPLDLVGSHET